MKRRGWSNSLRRKAVTAIVLVGVLPLILFLFITYFEEQQALQKTIGINFKEIAVEAASRIEMQLHRGMNEAQQLATIPFIRTAVTEANRTYQGKEERRIKSIIRDWQQRWDSREEQHQFPLFVNRIATNYLIRWHDVRKTDYVAILVTDREGALVMSSIPQVDYYHGDTLWWTATIGGGEGQVYVSDLYFDPSFGTHVLNVSVPIYNDQRNTAIGAVSLILRRNSLFHSISEVAIGSTGHAMLMDTDGTPLICPILSPEEHSITSGLVREISQARASWFVAADDSHGASNSIVGIAPVRLGIGLAPESLGGKEWLAFVRQDPREALAPLDRLVMKLAAYGVAVFAILWGTGMLVGARLVKPIRTLDEGVQRIGTGKLDHRLVVKTGDEIEHLANAFNTMATNLNRSFLQLEQQVGEIRRLEEKYRDLIENAPEMIHQLDRNGRFIHVNHTELRKLGYQLEEMLGMHLEQIVPVERQPDLAKYLGRLMSEGRGHIETVFVTREGERIDVEIHSTVQYDPAGDLVYSRAFVRDITQRKRLEGEVHRYTTQLEQEVAKRTHELSESEKRYKVLFDLAADSILMLDPNGRISAVNKRQEHALGYPEAELVGTYFLDLVCSPFRHRTRDLIEQINNGEHKVPTQEIHVRAYRDQDRPVEMDLIRISGQEQPAIMVQLRDITERKRLEQRLQQYSEELERKVQERTQEIQETKQYLESLLENANDVIYTLDQDQRFTYVNSKIESWGYRKEDLLGRPYLSLLSRRHRGRRLKSTLDIGANQVYEVEVLSKAGDVRTAMISVSPLWDKNGAILGVLGIARDITETKKLEQQIRNSEKLASVGKLAAGVAHEINNPLGGMLNCLYNIRKGGISGIRQEEYLVSMEDGLRRVQKIVRQLLEFSQQHEPELSPIDLNGVIDRVLVLTNHAMSANHIELLKELDEALPHVLADRHMIEQVLMNLLLNAIQAIKENGVITIRTRVVEGMCEIEVQDTGNGILPEVRPHIFDPFFTTKGIGEGTGLGLSVSLGIIERHGGQIVVESDVGQGTVFTVRLPVVRERVAVGRSQ